MERRYFWCLLGVMILVGLTGCAGGKAETRQEIKPLEAPELEFGGVKFASRSFHGTEVFWTFEVLGKDERPATVSGCSFELSLAEGEPQRGELPDPGEVSQGEKKKIEVKADLPWPSEPQAIRDFLAGRQVPYKLEVTCGTTAAGEAAQLKAGDSGNVPLPRLPQLSVSGANAERFSGKEFRLNFELSLSNDNSFPVQVRKITYNIVAEGRPLTEGTVPIEESLAPSADTVYEITSGTLSVAADKSVGDLLKKPVLSYELKGEVDLGDITIPVDEKGTVSFPR